MKPAFLLFILVALLAAGKLTAQNTPAKPCTAPECSQFDFWLGHWTCTYSDTMHGTNYVTKEMGGCTIHEHFNDPSTSFTGESWSVYNPQRKIWQQTWIDNQGGYIVLTGEFKNGKMLLYTEPQQMPDGTRKQSRMVYYNITPTAFDWDWDATTDEGKTWKNNWRIHYKKRNAAEITGIHFK